MEKKKRSPLIKISLIVAAVSVVICIGASAASALLGDKPSYELNPEYLERIRTTILLYRINAIFLNTAIFAVIEAIIAFFTSFVEERLRVVKMILLSLVVIGGLILVGSNVISMVKIVSNEPRIEELTVTDKKIEYVGRHHKESHRLYMSDGSFIRVSDEVYHNTTAGETYYVAKCGDEVLRYFDPEERVLPDQ